MPTDISKIISDAAYQAYERRLLHQVRQAAIPHHVAIIMDGNRRFAREIGLGNVLDGHVKGRDKLEEVLEWCLEVGVRILTVFAFSTENLRRPSEEIQHLMHLFAENFRKVGDDDRVHRHKIRINVFGDRELLPAEVIEAIEYAEARTKDYDSYRFNLAVAYGGREEILQAIRDVVRDAQAGKGDPHDIDEKFFSKRLYTAAMPDPDLGLPTSGEEGISNFLLLQLPYSELYFVDVYWPGFRKIDFLRALRSYQMRQRRYGESPLPEPLSPLANLRGPDEGGGRLLSAFRSGSVGRPRRNPGDGEHAVPRRPDAFRAGHPEIRPVRRAPPRLRGPADARNKRRIVGRLHRGEALRRRRPRCRRPHPVRNERPPGPPAIRGPPNPGRRQGGDLGRVLWTPRRADHRGPRAVPP